MKINFLTKINPARDWKIMISLFALGLVLLSLFAWNVYLSSQIGGGYFTKDKSQENISVKMIDQNKLQSDLLLLENRPAAVSRVIDPSL
jgi:hypothetical protein